MQGNEPGIYKGDNHRGRRRRRLDKCCDEDTGESTEEFVVGHQGENVPELVSRRFLQALTHQFHTIEEHPHRPDESENFKNTEIHKSFVNGLGHEYTTKFQKCEYFVKVIL